jgi:hypothetical protein
MTCKRAAGLAAETNGEVDLERAMRIAKLRKKRLRPGVDSVRRGATPAFSDIIKDRPLHEKSAGEADF